MIKEKRKVCKGLTDRNNIGNLNSKGITLIALIITIIVMLILVGVTVTTALKGELFETAKRTTEETEMATIRENAEMIVASVVANSTVEKVENNIWEEAINEVNKEFEGSTKIGNIITTADNKYSIRINNDYTVEVAAVGILQNTYAPNDIIKVRNCNIWGNDLDKKNTYIEFEINDDLAYDYVAKQFSDEEKWTIVKEAYYNEVDTGKNYSTYKEAIDDVIVDLLNIKYFRINSTTNKVSMPKRDIECSYTSIEECLQDQKIQELNIINENQLYYIYCCFLNRQYYNEEEANKSEALSLLLNYDMSCYISEDPIIEVVLVNPDETTESMNYICVTGIYCTDVYEINQNGKYTYLITLNGKNIGSYTTEEVKEIVTNLLSRKVNVGDYVSYDAGVIDETNGNLYTFSTTSGTTTRTYTTNSNIKWRVLGLDGDKVLLVSESPIYDDNGEEYYLKMSASDNYVTQDYISKYKNDLDEISSIYGHGKCAQKAMSIKSVNIDTTNTGILYYNVNDTSNYTSFLLNDSFINKDTRYAQPMYIFGYSKIEEGQINKICFLKYYQDVINKSFNYYINSSVNGTIRPIVILNETTKTTGQNENGVWQITE